MIPHIIKLILIEETYVGKNLIIQTMTKSWSTILVLYFHTTNQNNSDILSKLTHSGILIVFKIYESEILIYDLGLDYQKQKILKKGVFIYKKCHHSFISF